MMESAYQPATNARPERGDEGYLLVGAIVAIFIVLLVLSVGAARVARQLQREKEVEAVHRGNEYVRAIRVFYRKNGNRYPTSVDQLMTTNNQRFLRQKYLDPMTGKDDWRLIHLGENQTTVKGFFGEELPGLTSGLGSASSLASSTGGSQTTGGSASSSAFNNSGVGSGANGIGANGSGANAIGSAGLGSGASGTNSNGMSAAPAGATGAGTGTGSGTGTGTGSGSGTGSTGLIMGIGSSATGQSIVAVNGQDTYETWEFLYDPRIEQLYAKATLFGGAISSGSPAGLGSASSLASPTGNASPTGTSPTGTTTSPNGTPPASPTTPGTATPP